MCVRTYPYVKSYIDYSWEITGDLKGKCIWQSSLEEVTMLDAILHRNQNFSKHDEMTMYIATNSATNKHVQTLMSELGKV